MGGERSLDGVLAGVGSGAGVPGLLGLLVAMEAGVPIPVPSDLVMLLLGERVSAGALPLWVAALALELVAVAGTAVLFLAARGPGRAVLRRCGGPGRLAVVAALLLVRRRTRATRVLAEGACPACLALGLAGGGLAGGRASSGPAAAGSPGGGA